MKIRVTSQFKVSGASDLDGESDRLFRVLGNLTKSSAKFTEPDVNLTIADRIVNVSVVVQASSWDEAESLAVDIITKAVQGIGANVRVSDGTSSNNHLEASIQGTELIPA